MVMIPEMWCNISNPQFFGHFLYIGSDVDVSMLRLIEPHEKTIIFIDTLSNTDYKRFRDLNLTFSDTSLHVRRTKNRSQKIKLLKNLISRRIMTQLGAQIISSKILSHTHLQIKCVIYNIHRIFNFYMRSALPFNYQDKYITTFTHIGFLNDKSRAIHYIFKKFYTNNISKIRYIQDTRYANFLNWNLYYYKHANMPKHTHRLAGTPQIITTCLKVK